MLTPTVLVMSCLAYAAQAQPLLDSSVALSAGGASHPAPLILRSSKNEPASKPDIDDSIDSWLAEIWQPQALQKSPEKTPAPQIASQVPLIFPQAQQQTTSAQMGESDWPSTLQTWIYEYGQELAGDDSSRRYVEEHWGPQHRANPESSVRPSPLREINVTASKRAGSAASAAAGISLDNKAAPGSSKNDSVTPAAKAEAESQLSLEPEQPDKADATEVQVEFLADEQVTAEMHDDTTVLRQVEGDRGDLVLFDTIHLWVGGSVQVDGYSMDGLFTHGNGGSREDDLYLRRAEGIMRLSLYDQGEIKVQYDFDKTVFRDLYWRWISDTSAQAITVGNQKEPLGLDFLMGNKFGTAMEVSAPTSAFGGYRSLGVRYNRWFNLGADKTRLGTWSDNRTYMTATLGAYGEDFESTHETDLAITGRITGGTQTPSSYSVHLGVSASYREGEFDSIAPRPEIREADRVLLAQPDADTQAIIALEAMYKLGGLHSQFELYYSSYDGGTIDAEGWGGYAQLGWIFGDNDRTYRPRWGLWAPLALNNKHVFEVFGRASLTAAEDDINPRNDLRLLTVGGNWYYQQFRTSLNLTVGKTRKTIENENAGNAVTARVQYLF